MTEISVIYTIMVLIIGNPHSKLYHNNYSTTNKNYITGYIEIFLNRYVIQLSVY
jgi:hypothetical protein